MIIGHLPAAYLVSRNLQGRLSDKAASKPLLIGAGLLGGVFPDFDMFYYHLVDLGRHHHHSYWSHYPLVWLGLVICAALWWRMRKDRLPAAAALLFSLNGFAHLCLDTALGQIRWLAPFIDRPLTLFELPARYEPWWLNFVLSPTFLLELVLLAWAVLLFLGLDSNAVIRGGRRLITLSRSSSG